MARWRPDPTFYPTARAAMDGPAEQLAYVVTLNTSGDGRPDALCVLDVDMASPTRGEVVGRVEMPQAGDELHHFGWSACSSALCPNAPHPHVERRYLVVPGLRSSRIYVLDTKPDPRQPRVVKTVEPNELAARSGYSRPHTVHCGPDGIYVSAFGAPNGEGPGGVFVMDHEDFSVRGAWEADRGPQYFAYDFWWHLGHDVMITSEWATPNMVENGLIPDLLLAGKYGHALHVWDLRSRRHLQTLDLGTEQQFALELRPSHDPNKTYGFVNAVVSLKDLSSSIWVWHRDNGAWAVQKVIEIPAEPVDPALLPPALQPFGAVPPLVSDIDLSVDDRWLYVSCWGTGELKQYDVSDPHNPREAGSVRLGGIVDRTSHPASPELRLAGAPQMVEISRDGRRVYVTNSLYSSWDDIFYPDGVGAWMARIDANTEAGGLTVEPKFFPHGDDFRGLRVHQTRLQGGDASSDSYCFVD
jgi:methanethiol oxidase